MKIVKKFGGSSVATLKNIKKIASMLKNDLENDIYPIVVVSAMDTTTNNLVSMAYNISDRPNAKDLDNLLSTGEVVTASLLSIALNDIDVKATSVTGSFIGIKTNSYYGLAKIIDIDTKYINSLIDKNIIPIIAGFQGVDKNHNITTLGRGGSDLSAIALADSLKIQSCELYKDVSGIYQADPKIVKNTHIIKNISTAEIKEMSSTGAYIINREAVKFIDKVNLKIRSIFEENKLESNISKDIKISDLVSISCQKNVVKIIGKKNIDFINKYNLFTLNIDENATIISHDDFSSLSIHTNFNEKNLERNLATISIVGKDINTNLNNVKNILSNRSEDILDIIKRKLSITIVINNGYLKDILNMLNDNLFHTKEK